MKEKRCVDDYMMKDNMHEQMQNDMNMNMMGVNGMCMQPIYECPCERIINREINHEVKHIKPVHTRIVNHHIYHHTFTPCYTCSEEDEICNVFDGNCGC